ncbi:Uncharacterised protein [uncultured archaeon]|nr:Uncharacterised protein [uncultured archaeon]
MLILTTDTGLANYLTNIVYLNTTENCAEQHATNRVLETRSADINGNKGFLEPVSINIIPDSPVKDSPFNGMSLEIPCTDLLVEEVLYHEQQLKLPRAFFEPLSDKYQLAKIIDFKMSDDSSRILEGSIFKACLEPSSEAPGNVLQIGLKLTEKKDSVSDVCNSILADAQMLTNYLSSIGYTVTSRNN